jgi:hypothetical protein
VRFEELPWVTALAPCRSPRPDSAAAASRTMAGTLYGNYYDLPPESHWTTRRRPLFQWGKETAADFAELCTERAQETGPSGGYVARNGAVLEQSQILTTHNLAVLVDGLGLDDRLREQAPELAGQALSWVVRRLAQRATTCAQGRACGRPTRTTSTRA